MYQQSPFKGRTITGRFIYFITFLNLLILITNFLYFNYVLINFGSFASEKKEIRNNGKKLAILIPYKGELPEWMKYTVSSTKFSKLYEWHFFLESIPEYLNEIVVNNNLKNVHLHLLPSVTNYIFNKTVQFFGIKDELEISRKFEIMNRNIKTSLCYTKTLYGYIFKEFISEEKYSHWGFGDIDLIYGDIDKFTTDEMLNNYSIFTFSHMNGGLYLRGQFTMFKNNEENLNLSKRFGTSQLLHYMEKGYTPEGLSVAEFYFPNDLIENSNIPIYHEALQVNDCDFNEPNLYFEFKNGRLLFYIQNFNQPTKRINFWEGIEDKFEKNGTNNIKIYREDGHFVRYRLNGKKFKLRNARVFSEFAIFHFQNMKNLPKLITAKNLEHFAVHIDSQEKLFKIVDVQNFYEKKDY